MSKWKKAILFFICAAMLIPLAAPISAVEPSPVSPAVSAQSAVMLEWESGALVYEKNAVQRLPMASTTKIMTALVALEAAAPETVITVPACAVGTEGSSVYLVEGEQLTLEQLLYALLLESANDAAVAIAVGVAGSTEAFCERMNQKAAALGLSDTHFCNPHGLDEDDHYTTAYDLARLARYALQNALFATIVSTRKTTIPHAGTDGVRLLVNHNKLLRTCKDCIGIKTGYTSGSGRCLVSAAERDGVTVIVVTLNAPDDWKDHQSLYEYGFSQYRATVLCEENDYRIPLSVVGGTDGYALLCNTQALSRVLPRCHGEIRTVVELRRFEYAPIEENSIQGNVVFRCDTDGDGKEEEIGRVPLRAAYSVPSAPVKKGFWQWLLSLFGF